MPKMEIDVTLSLTCDKCGQTSMAVFYGKEDQIEASLLSMAEEYAESQGWFHENMDCSDGVLRCDECWPN